MTHRVDTVGNYSCMDSEFTKNRYSDYLGDCENDHVKPMTYSEFLRSEYEYWSSSIFKEF